MMETLKEANRLAPRNSKKIVRKGSERSVPKAKAEKVKKITKIPIKYKGTKKVVGGVAPMVKRATFKKPVGYKNLPMPAYGFIDVCFCIDATGSMCG